MQEIPEKRNVVLGITGSIAAYKSAEVARILVSRGYEVRTIMTQSAQEFISPCTLQAVTGNPVVSDFWDSSEVSGIGHIQTADWAEVVVIAPATADVIAKIAHGFADTPLLATVLATKAPVLVAPAMNVNMYENKITEQNIETLRKRGFQFIDPEEGALACGWNGTGRMADPWEIFYNVRRALTKHDFSGHRILITTGPTREPIDPVRYISNRSSGKMGVALAQEAFRRGAEVTLVHGPVDVKVPSGVRCIPVTTGQEMYDVILESTFGASISPHIVIMAAAVSDFRVDKVSDSKIKRSKGIPTLSLSKNPDILLDLGKKRGKERSPLLVGFAVETGEIEDLISEARSKLEAKNMDLIVGNFAEDAFDLNTNRVWLVDKTGKQQEVATTFKTRVATKIFDAIKKLG